MKDTSGKFAGKIQVDRTAGNKQNSGPVQLPQWRAPLKRSEAKRDLQPTFREKGGQA